MNQKLPFRAWYYFRMGWTTYFAFIFAAINTMVVTYYLAIEKAPILKEIFPTFFSYLGFAVMIGIPLLVLIGYVHYKKSNAYASEADITIESNPYYYKMPPGYWRDVLMPMYELNITLLRKILQNEKLSDKELKKLEILEKDFETLKKGGSIGTTKKHLN